MAIPGNQPTFPDPYTERLQALPMVPRKQTYSDGIEPSNQATTAQAPGATDPEPIPTGPTLETVDDQMAFRTVEQLVRSQDRLACNRWAIDTYFRWVDSGIPFSRLEKVPNQNIWVAKRAPGVRESPAAVPNKASDLCTKVTDALLADPPKPNPTPRNNGPQSEEAGEVASQFLRINGGESGINEVQKYRWALRNALACCSSFVHYRVDQDAGGYQPLQILAHPQAQDPNQPLVAMVPDPMTGQPQPQTTPDPILRYVSAQGQFVQTAAEADRVWLPAIKVDQLRREQVRTFPPTKSVEEADCVILLLWMTLAEARKEWPETVGTMTAEQLAGLASWRPSMSEFIVPYTFRGGLADGMTGPAVTDVGNLSPLLQRRMFYYRCYVRADKMEYTNGLQLDVSGKDGGFILGREALDYTVPEEQGGEATRCRDIPVAQLTPIPDIQDMDPMGFSFMARFAPSTEAAATLYAAYLDALDQRIHPHIFIRSTTAVDEQDWADRTQPIILNPTDPEPTYEQFPPLPDVIDVVRDIHQQDDVASGLTATAQGLETNTSESGKAKQLTVRQAQVNLATIQQQFHAFCTRGWRLCCQIAQAKFTTPRLLQYTGEEGSAEVQYFTGEDFGGIDDIGIEPGTGTLMTAEDKANYVAFLQGQQWLTPDRAADVAMAGIARDLGLPPNPATQAVERSVKLWLQGPDPQWLQQMQQYTMQVQQAQQQIQGAQQQQQAQGIQPTPAPAPPPPPVPPNNPFPPRPCDTEPEIAMTWMKRLGKVMLSNEYLAQPPEWRQLLDNQYMMVRQALQPPPVLPKGVTISAKGDASTIGAEEQAAIQGAQPQQPPRPMAA